MANDMGGLIIGARRLQELQQRRITGLQLDNASYALNPEPHLRCIVEFNDAEIGWWTRTDTGALVARFFREMPPCETDSVDVAHKYSEEAARKYQRWLAQRPRRSA